MKLPDVEISESLKNSPEDLDLLRQCVLDRSAPWSETQFNNWLKSLEPQILYQLYRATPEQLFQYVFEQLGEPMRLKKLRITWERENSLQGELLPLKWESWEQWKKIRRESCSA